MPVYLDYNATTPLLPAARDAWLACQEANWANGSSTHIFGQQARHTFDSAKKTIATLISCKPHELILCGGGSEANALAIYGVLHLAGTDKEILCGAADHSSILRNADAHGMLVKIAVDSNACIDLDALSTALHIDTAMVCFQFANNELGTLQDIPSLTKIIRTQSPHAHIHVDACQGTGKYVIACDQLDIDSLCFTGHKFGAPKGNGILYLRSGAKLTPLIQGGQQQQDRRSGTEDVAAICALAAALKESLAHCETESQRQRDILQACWQDIQKELPLAQWLAYDAVRLPGTMSLAYPG
ncbi:MAG: aminotransferase class V-fold PLP-dependent enzyme, partial [Planctomycetes bacterium]|nr:aminotransferase class V-fold PLP-dependent enzyme [Planctomycetota bacterium]